MHKIYKVLVTALLLLPLSCRAELFFYPALSTSTVGTAYANAAAGTEDITQQFYNPAVTCYFYNHQFGVSPSLYIPRNDFTNGYGRTAEATVLSGDSSLKDFAPPIGGGGVYGSIQMRPWLRLGMAITTPWRRRANFAPDWIGRYYGTRLELMSTNLTPTLAFSIRDVLCFSIGPQFDYMNIKYEEAIDFGSIAQALGIGGASPGYQDGYLKVSTHNWAYGWVAGVIFKPCYYIRLGLGYRTELVHSFCCQPKYTLSSIGEEVNQQTDQYNSYGYATLAMNCPQMFFAGIHYYHDKQCEFSAGLMWKEWSKGNGIRIKYTSKADTVLVQDGWRDTFSASIGGRYSSPCRTWYLRMGGMWEQDPTPIDVQTPLFFSEETATIAAGLGWNICEYAFLDIGWAHVFSKPPQISQLVSGDGNEYRGDLYGKIQTKSDTVSFSFVAVF